MKNRRIRLIVSLTSLVALFTLPAASQMLQIDYTATVRQLSGEVPAGVALGSTITGRVEVDLQYLPPDCSTAPWYGCYDYASRAPGYVFQFDTGVQSVTLDSAMAAQDAGISPGIFLYNLA